MSYLAFELDALKMVPDAARAAGLSEPVLGYGLVRLWDYCWTAKTDRIQPAHLTGFFGGEPTKIADALGAFGFLESDGLGFRVRGAARYLRLHLGQREGGKKSKGNLIPGPHRGNSPRKPAGGQPEGGAGESLRLPSGSPPALAGESLRLPSGSPPALQRAASSEQRIETDQQPACAKPEQSTPDQLAPGLVRFETARQEYFGTPNLLIHIPAAFETRWRALMESHEEDEDWALETYQHFWLDPWAQRRKPPGSLEAFLHPEQWPKYVQARGKDQPRTVHQCAHCGLVTQGQYEGKWCCYLCASQAAFTDTEATS